MPSIAQFKILDVNYFREVSKETRTNVLCLHLMFFFSEIILIKCIFDIKSPEIRICCIYAHAGNKLMNFKKVSLKLVEIKK